jgi:hypothetical protein
MKKQLLSLLAALALFAVLVPMGVSAQTASSAAKQCEQGGFVNWSARQGGPPFANTGQCVSASARGTVYPAPSLTIVRDGTSDIYGQQGTNILYCFYWDTYNNLPMPEGTYTYANRLFDVTYYVDGVLDSISHYTILNGVRVGDIVAFGKTQVIVVTDRQTGEVLVTGKPQVCAGPA